MCVCTYFIYNTYTHRVARPFDVAAKAGTVRPASWDGMHRTQHKMPHSYTDKQIDREEKVQIKRPVTWARMDKSMGVLFGVKVVINNRKLMYSGSREEIIFR